MAIDPLRDISCPFCGCEVVVVDSLVPGDFVDDGAYVSSSWHCPSCRERGSIVLHMSFDHAVVSDSNDVFVMEVFDS